MKAAMMRRPTLAAILAVVLVSGALVANAQQVRANWSKDAPFSQYRTYTWIPSEATNHPFYRQYVGEYVNYALTHKKHMREVGPDQNPDLLVTYHFTTKAVTDMDTFGYGFGPGWGGWGWGGWGWGGGMFNYSQTRPSTRIMGFLTIDIVDAHTRKIVWRGEAVQDDVTKSGDAEEKQIAKSVYEMFKRYPPPMKKS